MIKMGIIIISNAFSSCESSDLEKSMPNVNRDEYEILTSNVQSIILEKYSNEMIQLYSDIQELIYTFDKHSGKWKDVDYERNEDSVWGPMEHLRRIRTLSLSYHSDVDCVPKEITSIINSALDYFRMTNYQSVNWWFNSIGACTIIGETLVLAKNYISENNLNWFVHYINNGNIKEITGANKMDYAWFHLMRGICLSNDSIIKECSNEVSKEVQFVPHEGIQVDYSFLSNDIRYFGGYGLVYLKRVLEFAKALKETDYQIPPQKIDLLRNFFIKSFLPTFQSTYIDYNAVGRQISRKNHLNHNGVVQSLIEDFKQIDIAHIDDYNNASGIIVDYQKTLPYCSYWYKCDYLLSRNKRFNISVGGSSARVKKPEIGNGENLKGSLLSLGSTSYRIHGDEYYNIFAFWDWSKIPGVTSTDEVPSFVNMWGEYGGSVFSGGVTDGETVAAYSFVLNQYGLNGRKSYFLTNDGLICMGSDLRGNGNLYTTVDQCFYQSDFAVVQKKAEKPLVVKNNDIYYANLADNAFITKVENKIESWKDINLNEIQEWSDSDYDNLPKERKLLTLYLEDNNRHDYAYFVMPNFDGNRFKERISSISVVSNSNNCHAVHDTMNNCIYITFFDKEELKIKDFMIKPDNPCIMIIKKQNNQYKLILSDPLQSTQRINVIINGHNYLFNLPQDDYRGASQELLLCDV